MVDPVVDGWAIWVKFVQHIMELDIIFIYGLSFLVSNYVEVWFFHDSSLLVNLSRPLLATTYYVTMISFPCFVVLLLFFSLFFVCLYSMISWYCCHTVITSQDRTFTQWNDMHSLKDHFYFLIVCYHCFWNSFFHFLWEWHNISIQSRNGLILSMYHSRALKSRGSYGKSALFLQRSKITQNDKCGS